MNRFGHIFCVTTWGESHGPAIGAVIDGCPAGLELCIDDIQKKLDERKPGTHPHVSPRKEPDEAEILSGIFEGQTTGAPISIIIYNRDVKSAPYDALKNLFRPGHANYTYLKKYGVFDHRGGGRASARETAARVAAGAVAHKLLELYGIEISTEVETGDIEAAMADGDSVGGVVSLKVDGVPVGLGAPVFDKLEADLAKALMSIPASKGFEIGEGFRAAMMKGSEHNDEFFESALASNHAGGTLGGISTGEQLVCKIAFKPTSSIKKKQLTTTLDGKKASFSLPDGHRHDPCVALRAAPVVASMVAITLADHVLLNRLAQIKS